MVVAGCAVSPSSVDVEGARLPATGETPAAEGAGQSSTPEDSADGAGESSASEAAQEANLVDQNGGLTQVDPDGLPVGVFGATSDPSSGPLIMIRDAANPFLSAVSTDGEVQRSLDIGSNAVASTGYPDTALVYMPNDPQVWEDNEFVLVNMRTGEATAVLTAANRLPDIRRSGDDGRFAVLIPRSQLSERFILVADLDELRFWKVPQEFGDLPLIEGSTLTWYWEGRRYSASLPDMTVSDVVLEIANQGSAKLDPSGENIVWVDRQETPFTWRNSSLVTGSTIEIGAFPEVNVLEWADETRLVIVRDGQAELVDSQDPEASTPLPADFVLHPDIGVGRFLISDPADTEQLAVFDTATQATKTYNVPAGAQVVTTDAFDIEHGEQIVWAISDVGDWPIRGWWFARETGEVGSFVGDAASSSELFFFSSDERMLFAAEQPIDDDHSGEMMVTFSVTGAITRAEDVRLPCVGEMVTGYGAPVDESTESVEAFLFDSVDASTGVSLGTTISSPVCLTPPPD